MWKQIKSVADLKKGDKVSKHNPELDGVEIIYLIDNIENGILDLKSEFLEKRLKPSKNKVDVPINTKREIAAEDVLGKWWVQRHGFGNE